MKLQIEGEILYAGGLMFCRVEAGNGRTSIPFGLSEVEVRTAAEHGDVPLAYADGHGWMGGSPGMDIIVGRVVGRNGVLPCKFTETRLVRLVESAADRGERVTMEVQG